MKAAARRLRGIVEVLATDIGPRHVGAPERYALAERFLSGCLGKMGYEVRRLAVPAPYNVCGNLEVRIPGAAPDAPAIIVSAHYDSVPECPAANDNGSGVAGVLEIARWFAERCLRGEARFEREIRFVLFVNEEPPFFNLNDMGSQHYARGCRARGERIDGMICLETIGCYSDEPGSQTWPQPLLGLALPDRGDFITFVGSRAVRGLIGRAAESFRRQAVFPLLAADAPDAIDEVNWSDHRGFVECGYEGFMVTDTAPLRYPHYHQPTDTPEKLDYIAMARVIRGVAGVVRDLAEPGNATPRGSWLRE